MNNFPKATQRLVNRDSLTKEQAEQRVNAQPTNETMVKVSNVVFSTQWSYEFSESQVKFLRRQILNP